MAYNTLNVHAEGHTLIITINREQVMNALNAELIKELEHCIDELNEKDEYRGAIITGSGEKAFAAGADIAEINALDEPGALLMSQNGHRTFDKIEHSSKPVVAAVNGFALGGGCELAMSCHFRIASENAKFGQPEVNLGLIAGYGGTQRLPLLIGKGRATEYLLTGDMIDADTARQMGLVNHVVPAEQLIPKTLEVLNKIYKKSPLAVELTLNAINRGVRSSEVGYSFEKELFAKSVASQDGKEGTSAFLEKRKPAFAGK